MPNTTSKVETMWEIVKTNARGIKLGTFQARKTMSITYSGYEGKPFTWYVDRALKIAKLQFEKNGVKTAGKMISLPTAVQDMLGKDEEFILWMDEDVAFMSPYKKGQEFLEKFLKKEGNITT